MNEEKSCLISEEERVHEDLKNRFTYHAPKEGQPEMYEAIRGEGFGLACTLTALCPKSRELSLALTKLEEVVFWANASIARKN